MKNTLKKLWNNLYVMQFLSLTFSLFIPALYTINYYGLFKDQQTRAISSTTMFIIFIVIIRLSKEIKKIFRLINDFFYRLGGSIKKPLIWGIIMILMYQVRNNINDMIIITQVWFYFTLIGSPLIAQYDKLYEDELIKKGIKVDKKSLQELIYNKLQTKKENQ